jgi:phosphonate transport system ATP-binding protein
MAMLELQGLTRRFGAVVAVDAVSLAIPAGQMVGIIGRSGAGKSTLLRMMNRLAEPDAGRILADGRDVTSLRGRALCDWRSECGMVFQQFNLVQRLDVLTNVLLGRLNRRPGHWRTLTSLLKLFTAAERAMALAALDRFGLAETALQRAGTLSGGQQQMVSIARALLTRPRALLLDEPSIGLAPKLFQDLMEPIARLRQERGVAILLVEQNLREAFAVSDRVIVMRSGRFIFEGTPADLSDHTKLMELF